MDDGRWTMEGVSRMASERTMSPVYLPAYGYPVPVGAYDPDFERVSA